MSLKESVRERIRIGERGLCGREREEKQDAIEMREIT